MSLFDSIIMFANLLACAINLHYKNYGVAVVGFGIFLCFAIRLGGL